MENHFVVVGHGREIATYWKEDFQLNGEVNCKNYQMTKVSSEKCDVINIYRSSSAEDNVPFINDLSRLINIAKETFVLGDMNICYATDRNHIIFRELECKGFKQYISKPTHVKGNQIDHVFYYSPNVTSTFEPTVNQYGQYFTDHDLIQVVMGEVCTKIYL